MKPRKTVVVRVPVELRNMAKDWQKLLGSTKEVDGWKQIQKISKIKSDKIYPKAMFKI